MDTENEYKVIVENIGIVYHGRSHANAWREWLIYVGKCYHQDGHRIGKSVHAFQNGAMLYDFELDDQGYPWTEFMEPDISDDDFIEVGDNQWDTYLMPADLEGVADGRVFERFSGNFFWRLSAPGYLDSTEWSGPCESLAEALAELLATHYLGDERCIEEAVIPAWEMYLENEMHLSDFLVMCFNAYWENEDED